MRVKANGGSRVMIDYLAALVRPMPVQFEWRVSNLKDERVVVGRIGR
jgi:hypothetical protein